MALPFELTKKVKGKHGVKLYKQMSTPKKNATRGKVLAEARKIRKQYYRE